MPGPDLGMCNMCTCTGAPTKKGPPPKEKKRKVKENKDIIKKLVVLDNFVNDVNKC